LASEFRDSSVPEGVVEEFGTRRDVAIDVYACLYHYASAKSGKNPDLASTPQKAEELV